MAGPPPKEMTMSDPRETPGDPADENPEQHPDRTTAESEEELGSLTVEDDPEGTVDPSELAGSAGSDDDDPMHAEHTEHDVPD
jgi:hypothetical protein